MEPRWSPWISRVFHGFTIAFHILPSSAASAQHPTDLLIHFESQQGSAGMAGPAEGGSRAPQNLIQTTEWDNKQPTGVKFMQKCAEFFIKRVHFWSIFRVDRFHLWGRRSHKPNPQGPRAAWRVLPVHDPRTWLCWGSIIHWWLVEHIDKFSYFCWSIGIISPRSACLHRTWLALAPGFQLFGLFAAEDANPRLHLGQRSRFRDWAWRKAHHLVEYDIIPHWNGTWALGT